MEFYDQHHPVNKKKKVNVNTGTAENPIFRQRKNPNVISLALTGEEVFLQHSCEINF